MSDSTNSSQQPHPSRPEARTIAEDAIWNPLRKFTEWWRRWICPTWIRTRSSPSSSSSGSNGPASASSSFTIGVSWKGRPSILNSRLNQERYRGAGILVTRANFGCGSSREHAPWSLLDYGFRCIIAPSFADIFFNNCFKNGLLPVRLSEEQVEAIFQRVRKTPGFQMTVDLQKQRIQADGGMSYGFRGRPLPAPLPPQRLGRHRPHPAARRPDLPIRIPKRPSSEPPVGLSLTHSMGLSIVDF